jgi:magnesium-transporting ATPase (P-type)
MNARRRGRVWTACACMSEYHRSLFGTSRFASHARCACSTFSLHRITPHAATVPASSASSVVDVTSEQRVSLTVNHVALRGTQLRQTEWVVGLVINTGLDTKVEQNSTPVPHKQSHLEQRYARRPAGKSEVCMMVAFHVCGKFAVVDHFEPHICAFGER